jgi:predicted ATPase
LSSIEEVLSMLTRIQVQNFRNLRDVDIALGPLNVFVGPNGSGKSSLLLAIDFLRGFFHPEMGVAGYLEDREWTYNDIPNVRHKNKVIRWSLSADLDPLVDGAISGTYEYHITLSKRKYLYIGQEKLEVASRDGSRLSALSRKGSDVAYLDRTTGDEEDTTAVGAGYSAMAELPGEQRDEARVLERFPELVAFREWVRGFRAFLALDPRTLRAQSRREHDELGPSGEYLASVVARMKDQRPKQFSNMLRRVQRLLPWVQDISAHKGRWGWTELKMRENGHLLNSRQMSDGLLRLIAVASFLYTDETPTLLSFEEPENGVHPQLLRELVQIFRDLTNLKPPRECQVVFTTHSPYVLDEFIDSPEQVYLMEKGPPEQGSHIVPLCDRENVDIVRDTFEHSLGEAWFSGVIGGTAGGYGG